MKANVNIVLDPEIIQWARENRINISQVATHALTTLMQTPKKEVGEEAKLQYETCMKVLMDTLYDEDRGHRSSDRSTAIVFAKTWMIDLRKYGFKYSAEELLDSARSRLIARSRQ